MHISDWSSDVCSSDLSELAAAEQEAMAQQIAGQGAEQAEIDATDAEPLQAAQTNEEQAEQARAKAAADVDIRVGLSIRPWGEVFINGDRKSTRLNSSH